MAWDAEVRANAIKGIIFYIDKTGEHGLIAAGEDLKDTYYWMNAYWSSTEYGKGRAWYQDFNRGHQGAAFETPQRDQKIAKFHVRVIRTF